MAARKRSPVADIVELKRLLKQAAILVDGGADLYNERDRVHVALVFDVSGYGPHPATIFASQQHVDAALEDAYGLLEEWAINHYPKHLADLEKEYGDQGREVFTETFDGRWFTMPFRDFARAIRGTKAEKYIDLDVE